MKKSYNPVQNQGQINEATKELAMYRNKLAARKYRDKKK